MKKLVGDMYPEDISEIRFGKLVAKYKCDVLRSNSWHCICDCGNEVDVPRCYLVRGWKKSCSRCVYKVEKHGDSKTRFYSIYKHMKSRCCNEKADFYANYGGRGIKVCDEWLESYLNFKEDMYESYLKHVEEYGEKDTTIDRIDVDGNYCKENCRWATRKEQSDNRRGTRYVAVNDELVVACNLPDNLGLSITPKLFYTRLDKGMSTLDALYTPVSKVTPRFFNGLPLKQYCIKYNVDYRLVMSRIYMGWDIKSAVEAPKGVRYEDWLSQDGSSSLKVHEIIYYKGMSLRQYCLTNELPYKRISSRVSHGWDIEDAINAPKGTQYKTWLKMKENNKNSLDNNE